RPRRRWIRPKTSGGNANSTAKAPRCSPAPFGRRPSQTIGARPARSPGVDRAPHSSAATFVLHSAGKLRKVLPMKIALDAMGGDFGPPNLIGGAKMALEAYSQISKLFLVGDTAQIEAELKKLNCSDRRIEIVHSSQVVDMSDKAWSAVRRKKDSSISRAVDLVKHGQADAIVSAGHTGAAVAASMIKLRTLPGVDRPGIAAVLPTETNVFVLVDAGANIDARPEHLLQYAYMGSVYSRHVLG